MVAPVITARPATTLAEVARLMLDHRVGCIVIVAEDDPEKVVGIVTETDFDLREQSIPFSAFRAPKLFGHWVSSEAELERAYESARRTPVRDIMRAPVLTVEASDEVWKAARLMLEHDIKRLPVLENGRLVGIVTRHDLLKRCAADEDNAAASARPG